MKYMGNIFLVWRRGKGQRRHKVGIIRRNVTDGIRFRYVISLEDANRIGFMPYADFPDLLKTYKQNVLDVFGQRLTKVIRDDIQKYYDFWEISEQNKDDKYYILAHTQGLLATDNFEFLADYHPIKGLSFISEICGLSHNELPPDIIQINDELRWEKDEQNKYDKYAVKVFKNGDFLGYVKKVHSKIFYKKINNLLKIKVKSIDKNGKINRVFINICNS